MAAASTEDAEEEGCKDVVVDDDDALPAAIRLVGDTVALEATSAGSSRLAA